uniref:Uncharacterized protein n=1 Tax=Moniliophthora roreri TaxID=221103 RepID=A0A0W0FD28_MONRR
MSTCKINIGCEKRRSVFKGILNIVDDETIKAVVPTHSLLRPPEEYTIVIEPDSPKGTKTASMVHKEANCHYLVADLSDLRADIRNLMERVEYLSEERIRSEKERKQIQIFAVHYIQLHNNMQ